MRIRLAAVDDAEAVAAIYRPIVEATPISFETVPPDCDEVARRIAKTLEAYPWLVCETSGGIAGYAYASRHRERAAYQWSVDVSVYVDARHRRSGVGRRLYLPLFAVLSAQGYVNAHAGITLPNAASVGLHESLGFQPLGTYRQVGYKLGAWHDVGWWQLQLRPHDLSPVPPIDLARIRERPDWESLVSAGASGP